MKARLHLVNVFSHAPYSGNPAAVVSLAEPIHEADMGRVAGELRMPGTGFTWIREEDGRRSARFFTPIREVGLSGHTALACATAVLDADPKAEASIPFETSSATLRVDRTDDRWWLALPSPSVGPFEGFGPVMDALGISISSADPSVPVMMSGDRDVLIWLADEYDPTTLRPDLEGLAAVSEEKEIRGVCVVSSRTIDPQHDLRIRFFAPAFGIPEDVSTGSVRGPLVALALAGNKLPGDQGLLKTEQGDCIGRPSVLDVRYRLNDTLVSSVEVGGETFVLARGEIALPS